MDYVYDQLKQLSPYLLCTEIYYRRFTDLIKATLLNLLFIYDKVVKGK